MAVTAIVMGGRYLSDDWPPLTMLTGRERRLEEPLIWIDEARAVCVPAGFICDLASIPRCLWWWAAPDGVYRPAVVIHDYDYKTQRVPRSTGDRTFLRVMDHVDTRDTQARAMWLGVRVGGWSAWRKNRQALQLQQ